MKTSLLTLCLLLLFAVSETLAGVLRVGTWSSSGSTPHSTLTAALAAAQAGDEIWVASNTYREAELIIPAGVSVYGGFTGSETALSERHYATNVTILDGSGAHRVATVSGLLDGFTLRNGRTGDNGGGVIVKSGGTLSHCIAFANEAGYDGGGVFAEDNATVTNTLLTGNRAGNDGAALSGTPGYSAMNLTATDNLLTGMPVIDALTGVPASLQAGGVLDVAPPAISSDGGSTVLMKGWELDGNAISMPYTVTYADNGKKLRYWAANAVGVGVSNEVALTVTWTVTSSVQLLTPNAVCEGTTLADAGISNPVFSPAPDGGASYTYFIDGTVISGLDYQLQYADNGKLLTCEIKTADGTISGTITPAVRLAVMKTPEVLLATVASLSIEEGQPLCLPTPVVISNGSDITAQGWKWRIGAGGAENTFNSCDKATMAMNGAEIYYTAENGCGAAPAKTYTSTLTITAPVGEFLQTVSALCSGMTLDDCISFADGGNTGDYYLGTTKLTGNSWAAVKTTPLTVAHNLQVLRFSYNGGKSERRMTLTVHAVPEITTDPVTPANALCLGDAHTLTIEATGDNLSYQWERSVNSTDGTDGDWDNVPGSTTAACRLTADVSAYYRCTVTGVCIDHSTGVVGNKIASSSAQLMVNDRPVISNVTFVASDLKICAGVEISTILTGKAPTLSGTAALDEGWTLGGIKIPADYKVLATDNGKVLGYWASNDCGERTATFSTGILAVTSRPELLQSPADVATEENSSVRLSVLTGAGVSYEWYRVTNSADPYTGGDKIATATSSSYVFTADELKGADLTNGKKETEYYCKVIAATNVCKGNNADPTIDPADPAYVLSDVAKVTVSRRTTDITITSQPEAFPETCAGTDKSISVTATGRGNLTCTWYSGSTAMVDGTNGTIVTSVNNIVPAPTNPLAADKELTSTFTPNAAGTYYCIIASTDNPGGVRSTQSVLTIHALPVLTDIAAGELAQTLCKDTDLSVKVSATGVGVTYEWQRSINNGTTYSAFGETDSRLRTAISGNVMYRCVVKATCVEKTAAYDAVAAGLVSSAVTVTMADKPGIALKAGTTLSPKCEGASIALNNADITVSDNHKPVAPADAWWTLGGLQIANTYNITRNDNGKTVGYSATNECGTTAVTFAAMKLTVDEKPQIIQDPVDVSAVEDSRVRLSVSASGSNLTYKWQQKANADADADANWHDIAGETNPVYSFTAANITAGAFDGADVLTDYRCVVGTTNACATTTVKSATATVTVTRNKSAVSIRRQPAAYEVCNSATAPYAPGFTVEVEGSGHFTYKWYDVNDITTPVNADAGAVMAAKNHTYEPSAAGTYFCVITSTDDAVGVQTQAVTLTVSQAPVINSITPANATICEGGSVTLGVDATGSALTYQWYQQAGANPAPATDTKKGTAPTYTPVGLTATAKFYCIVGSGSVCTSTAISNTVEVTIEHAPKITTQPLSQSVCGSTGVALSVVADNTDTWQWYYNGKAITEADGGKKATLTDVRDGGVYTCVVSKTGGVCGEATSVPALITVANSPEVKLGTATGLMACKGDLVTLASPVVEANGSVVVPEKTGWYLSTAADPATAPVVASCVVDNTVTYNYKITYKCSATSPETTVTAAMPAFTVTVNTPVAITSQPKDQNECDYRQLSVAATGTATISYKWYYNGAAATTADIDNIAAQSATPKKDGVYTCEVSNACGSVTSAPAVVKKKAATVIATQPVAATICKGESVSLGVKATGDDVTYQWYSGTTNNPTTVISGATSATLSVSPTVNTYYKCVVSGCTDVPSSVVLVTVRAATAITALSGQPSGKVCSTATMPTLAVAATGEGTLTYQWYKDGAAISGATGVNYTVKSSDLGSHNYEVKVTGGCGSMLSQSADVEIVKIPVVSLQGGDFLACVGEAVTLPVVSVETNGSVIVPGSTGWYDGGTAIHKWIVEGTAQKTFTYKVGYRCGDGAATKTDITTSIKVTPIVRPKFTAGLNLSQSYCEGNSIALTVPANVGSGLTTTWYLNNTVQSAALTANRASHDGKTLRCVISNQCGSDVAEAVLSVARIPTLQDLGETAWDVCEGQRMVLPDPLKDLNGSVLRTDQKSGWYNGATRYTSVNPSGTGSTKYIYSLYYTCGTTNGTLTKDLTLSSTVAPVLPAIRSAYCEGIQLDNVTAANATSWSWNLAGTVTTSKPTTNLTYAAHNDKELVVTASNRCGSSSRQVTLKVDAYPSFGVSAKTDYLLADNGVAYAYPDVPSFTPKGGTVTGSWVYGGSYLSATNLKADYTKEGQKLYYQLSYTGVCASKSDIRLQWRTLGLSNGDIHIVPNDLVADKITTMIDTRDGKEYNIKKLSNNQVWMVQNLDYGTCGTWNTSISQGNSQEITAANGSKLYGTCRSSADYGSAPKDNGKTYKYYNWQGAMQRSDTYYGSSAAPTGTIQGICPAGWHLPNKDEMKTMYDAVGSYANLTSTADNNASSWAGVLGGLVSSSGSFSDATSGGFYWSSSYRSTSSAYDLSFYSGGDVYPQDNYSKLLGFAVRCLKN